MKLFHKTPEGGLLKTGINVTQSSPNQHHKFFVVYFVVKNIGFVGFYFNFKVLENAKWINKRFPAVSIVLCSWKNKVELSFSSNRKFTPKIFRWKKNVKNLSYL